MVGWNLKQYANPMRKTCYAGLELKTCTKMCQTYGMAGCSLKSAQTPVNKYAMTGWSTNNMQTYANDISKIA